MKKFANVLWKLVFLGFWMPLFKVFCDIFTTPETGLFVVAGMDDFSLAFWTAVPWGLPIIVIILLINDLRKPDKPDSGLNIPQ